MRKVIASINITIDGFCDHTVMIADEELHKHYSDLLNNSGVILYGRTTYQLMEAYWPAVVKDPTGDKATDEFAVALENIPKIVFSRTLKDLGWKNERLAKKSIKEELSELKQQPGKDILLGSPSMIVAATNLKLVDEYQLCVHPVIAGNGLPLFKNVDEKIILKLIDTKTFGSGTVAHYYRAR